MPGLTLFTGRSRTPILATTLPTAHDALAYRQEVNLVLLAKRAHASAR
jgi:hypothetical protein